MVSLFMFEGRSKRTVKYRKNEDMWTYVASGKRLPGLYLHCYVLVSDLTFPLLLILSCLLCAVQWSAWLTHTRPDPPSIEVGHNNLT
jgi:NADH dehydrogenase [ubiquinone] 1 alpha subcomplex assembly factor 2